MKKKNPATLIIKKYENRRLYNTLTSQYINQDQVAQLVRDGYDVRVVDAATGEDLTRLTLAQIVLEDARTPNSVFPLDVLRQMVLASGRATQVHALRYMKAMTDMYQNAYRALPSPMDPFQFLQGRSAQPAPGGQMTGDPPSESGQPLAASATPAKASEVNELKHRIDELELMLTKRARNKNTRRAKSRRKA